MLPKHEPAVLFAFRRHGFPAAACAMAAEKDIEAALLQSSTVNPVDISPLMATITGADMTRSFPLPDTSNSWLTYVSADRSIDVRAGFIVI